MRPEQLILLLACVLAVGVSVFLRADMLVKSYRERPPDKESEGEMVLRLIVKYLLFPAMFLFLFVALPVAGVLFLVAAVSTAMDGNYGTGLFFVFSGLFMLVLTLHGPD